MHLKKRMLIISIMFFFVFMHNAHAVYESNSGTSYNGSVGSCGTTRNCKNNSNYFIMQARLYYINNASFTHIGKTYYFVNTSAYNALNGKGLNLVRITAFDGYGINAAGFNNGYNYLNNTYFKNTTLAKVFLNKITNTDNYDEILNKDNQAKGGTKGYRIVIEPVENYANPTFSTEKSALYTVKGLATEVMVINANGSVSRDVTETNKNNPADLLGVKQKSQWLYNDFNDVGIIRATNKEYCEDIDIEHIADIKYGCGYKLIDLSNLITPKKCYTQNGVKTKNGGVKCTNYNTNNEDTYSPNYVETSCSGKTESDKLNILKNYGKLVGGTNSCGIYCNEEAVVSLPGNVLIPVQQGSYFPWPSKADDVTGNYKMNITTKLTCHTVGTQISSLATTFERKCPSGYVAYTGTINGKTYDICRKGSALDKVCPSGYVKYNNICRKTTDTPKVCPSGYSVSVNATQCRNNSVQGKVCPSGYPNKYNNKCYKACPSGYVFVNGQCRKQISFVCSSSQYSSGGKCYDKKAKVCPSGWSVSGNQCAQVSGYYCDGGFMKSSANNCWQCGATMYTGAGGGGSSTSSIDASNSCGTWRKKTTRYCPGGYVDYASQCRKSKRVGKKCPSGSYACYNNGFCCTTPKYRTTSYFDPWSSSRSDGFIKGTTHTSYRYQAKVCPSGYPTSLSGTECRSNTAKNPSTCSGDNIGGKCYHKTQKSTPASTNLVCPSGASSVGGNCYILKNKICDTSKTVEISGKCYQKANTVCDSSNVQMKTYDKTRGAEKAPVKKDYAAKVCPTTHPTERNGRCVNIVNPTNISAGNYVSYDEYAATCPGGYSRTGSTGGSACSAFSYYSCPNGGSLSGSTCYKTTTTRHRVYRMYSRNSGSSAYNSCLKAHGRCTCVGYAGVHLCDVVDGHVVDNKICNPGCYYEVTISSPSTTSYAATAHYNYTSFNSCASGYSLEGTTCVRREKCNKGTLYNHACYTCSIGYSFSMANGKCEQTVDKICPSPFTNGVENGRCVRNRSEDNYCDNVSVTNVNAVTRNVKFTSTGHTYVKSVDRCVKCNTGRVASDGLCKYAVTTNLPKSVLVGSTCHEVTPKINDWSCPVNYTRSGTTCNNNCSRDSLISGVNSMLVEKPSIKLNGGTNNEIDEELISNTTVDVNASNLTFTSKTNFEINNNTNRYFNKETGAVANSSSGWNANSVFDRGQGVISLGYNDPYVANGAIKNYFLELKDLKFGTIYNYGSHITNYKCTYKLTSNSCKCPSGTDFEGVSVYDLISNICNLKDNDETCADLQYRLCNKPSKYNCKNSSGGLVDITSCVDGKVRNGKKPYTAFLECRNSNGSCLKYCDTSFDGKCTEQTQTVGNVILNIVKCNNKTYSITPYCKLDNASVSSSSVECIATKLNLKSSLSLKKAIDSNKVNNSQLLAAAKSCESTICGKQKLLFRTIDLSNPFYGNGNRDSLGLSLTGNKSRLPGSNWNSKSLVTTNILTARNKQGNKLYTKDPLYTIVLTPQNVKDIREYNKSHSYLEFDLKCNSNNTYGCISSFIHGDTDSLKDMGVSVTGLSSCTTMNMITNATDYKKCYNSNN